MYLTIYIWVHTCAYAKTLLSKMSDFFILNQNKNPRRDNVYECCYNLYNLYFLFAVVHWVFIILRKKKAEESFPGIPTDCCRGDGVWAPNFRIGLGLFFVNSWEVEGLAPSTLSCVDISLSLYLLRIQCLFPLYRFFGGVLFNIYFSQFTVKINALLIPREIH